LAYEDTFYEKKEEPKLDSLSALTNALASLTAATEIAVFLKDSELSLPKDEMKLKLAELTAAIAEAKLQIAEIANMISEKDQTIKFLQDKINQGEEMVFEKTLYWSIKGDKKDGPFCPQCWDHDHRKIRLYNMANVYWMCRVCNNSYKDST
jgi:chromosome segregation ATPase